MKLAFILDPLDRLDPGHDSTVAMMEAAQQRGHEVWVLSMAELSVVAGEAWGKLAPLTLKPVTLQDGRWQVSDPWYSVGEAQWQPLTQCQAVFMRKDPPVTIPYLYATYILDLLTPTDTWVINQPHGLRSANEKLYTLQFAEVMPETLVTQDKGQIREFVDRQGQAILKPLGGKAGEGILFLQSGDRNLNSMVEISTRQGQEPVMIQRFLPEAKDGDKRIILLDGDPIGAVNRIPSGAEFRGNMAVGGQVAQTTITDREREICQLLKPRLQADGLYFVGIDVIGGYLTEVNVTSPTGIREIDRLSGSQLGQTVIHWLEKHIHS